jgi:electron transport complex protein RnfA
MPYGMEYLSLMSSVIVSLTIVILAEKFIKRFMKKLYQYIRDYYSIVTMNGIALALVISEMQFGEPVMETVISAALVTGGFAIALLILAGIRERMERNSLPAYFKGMPIALLVMSLILKVLDGLESLF